MSSTRGAIGKEPCPSCGSPDNLRRWPDGHAWCFSPGCRYWEPAHGEKGKTIDNPRTIPGLLPGEIPKGGLTKRKISEQTCQRYAYLIGFDWNDRPIQLAQYRDLTGQVVGQKLRYADKHGFPWTGNPREAVLFGQHLQGTGKRLFVTEGELDAMSLAEMLNNRWPVVSIINGAPNAKNDLLKQIEFLKSFEAITLAFDQDDAGRAAAEECALALASTVPVFVASYSLKDASDMLVEGRVEEMIRAVWNAPKWRPKTIITLEDVREKLQKPPEMGRPWPWQELTDLTYGRRPGELYAFSSGVGCGKTDTCHTWEAFDLVELGVPIAAFHLEEGSDETALRIASKASGKPLYLPGTGIPLEERLAAVNALGAKAKPFFYGTWGHNEWETIRDTLRYLHHAEGVEHFYLDHLTALSCQADDERRFLDRTMEEMASLTKELGLIGHFVSHLRTPDRGQKPHEEGGRVKANQFIGSRAIMQWAHFMFAIERNTQSKNSLFSTFRILKDRYTGLSTGKTFRLKYDPTTTLLKVTNENPFENEEDDEEADF